MSDLTQFRDHCHQMADPTTNTGRHLNNAQRHLFDILAREVDAYLTTNQPTTDDTPLDFT